MNPYLLPLIVAAPFVAALILLALPDKADRAIKLVSLFGATISLAGSIVVALQYDKHVGGLQGRFDVPLIPDLKVRLHLAVDGWGASLLLLTGIIIFVAVLASFTLTRRAKEFFVLLLVLVAGVFGVFVAQDILVFFLFYEIAVLPMYLLIGIWGSSHQVAEAGPFRFVWKLFSVGSREYAAMKLTIMLLVGSAAILVSILKLQQEAGGSFDLTTLGATRFSRTTQLVLFPLLWMGFGTLGGVFPFHTWSPDGHASAPTGVSMLHAGVLMKLGAFGVIRIGMVLLPEGAREWAPIVGAVAVLNVVYGAISATSQKDLKYIVAYSSVSHMGIVMLGAATLNPAGWNGAIFQMFAHGVMTGLLFALVGLVYERAHTRVIATMGGFGKVMPGVASFFTLACLSSLGLPGTAGFIAEMLVFLGAWKAHSWWAIFAVIGAFVTAVYVLRASRSIFWGPGPSEKFHELSDAKRYEWGALVLLGCAVVTFGMWPRLLLDTIDPTTGQYLSAVVGSAP
ncbi:MAG: NADH-quinone oxidoreductase subunit M [Polyangiaceae bacterium]